MKNLSSPLGKRLVFITTLLVLLAAGAFWLTRTGTAANLPFLSKTARFACNNTMMTEAEIAAHRGITVETLHLLQTQRGLTNENVCVMPEDKLTRAVNRATHPKPDRPDDALAFRLLQLRDENGVIPPDGLIKAAEQINQMKADLNSLNAGGISPDSWTWVGPGNIGGRIRAILIHPTNPNRMWVGSVSGGIWTTTNGGTSWQPVDDFMANLAVSTLVMQPGNSNVLYAGTGEGFYNIDGIQGAGVFKSTDGGVTWAQLASTNTSDWFYVNRLSISPNGSVILAATGSGIWRSTDGGANWTQPLADWTVKDINFHPTNNSKAIASGSGGTAWYSNDGGVTWNLASGLPTENWPGRVEVAYSRSNPSKVYASIEVNSGEIWRSTDGGQSYSLVNTGNNFLGGQGWYDNIIWVDPTDENTLIVGGIDLWRSTDGGANLTQMSVWWSAPESAHADHHAIVEHPSFNGSTNTTVYFGNDGGIYRASNVYMVEGTTGWQELNNNLGITQFYGAGGNPSTGIIVGGTQDNGTLLYSGNTEDWTTMFGGDGGFSAADPSDPNYFYGEYVNLRLHRSTNGGASSDYITGVYWYWNGSSWEERWKPDPYTLTDARDGMANFIAPFILDPNDSNRLFAGGQSLWRTNNAKEPMTDTAGPAWTRVKAPLASQDYISAIAVAPGNSNVVWVGYNNGDVYKTTNGTANSPTWVRVDTRTPPLPDRYVTRLAIDPNNPNQVYVTFGGFAPDNIWRTTNAGTNWSDATGSGTTGLPDAPVRGLVIHPENSNWVYAGTEVGIFASEDGGNTWSLPQDGPAHVSVDELFWMNDTLVAATHGRGLFKTTVSMSGQVNLTVYKTGTGGGTISSVPAGINCGSNCSKNFAPGTVVTLTAAASPGSTFIGWSGGGCSGTGTCTVTVSADTSVTAQFNTVPADLIIQSITALPANPQPNQTVTLSVVIKNQGQGMAENFYLDLFVDTALPEDCFSAGQLYQRIDSLPSGTTQTVTLTYPGFSSNGTYSINGIIDTNCNVAESNENNNTKSINVTVDSASPNTDVSIGGILSASYYLAPQQSMRQSFVGVNNGPVQIVNTENTAMIAAERVLYKINGVNASFTEMMGLPNSLLSTIYWLPWYNNAIADLDTQLRFANVSGSNATVHVLIGGTEMPGSPFTLAPGASTRKSFAGVNNGPVKIVSNVNIVAAERLIYKANNVGTSFSEMMALPNSQLNTIYWLPWYNNVDFDTQLRFANVSGSNATVHVYIGSAEMPGSPFTLAPGASTRRSFAGVNNGPVKIVSNVNIVAAERVIYEVNGVDTSYSEMMALPNTQLDTIYWLPWYNNVDLDTQLRFANISGSTATVHVYIGGLEMPGSPFTLMPGASTRKSFVSTNNGPVQIVSDVNIVAAERVIYKVNGVNTSFSEMMGLPDKLLNATYWFPWYNNLDLDTQLRFGVP